MDTLDCSVLFVLESWRGMTSEENERRNRATPEIRFSGMFEFSAPEKQPALVVLKLDWEFLADGLRKLRLKGPVLQQVATGFIGAAVTCAVAVFTRQAWDTRDAILASVAICLAILGVVTYRHGRNESHYGVSSRDDLLRFMEITEQRPLPPDSQSVAKDDDILDEE